MKTKIVFFLFLLLLLVNVSKAYSALKDEAGALFLKGNSYYSEGKFDEAISSYKKAVATGLVSGAIYYNLGNAYFKEGRLGKAIANYMRAKRLMPTDADLNSNLNYAKSLVKSSVPSLSRPLAIRIILRIADLLSLNKATYLMSFFYCFMCIWIIAFIKIKNFRKPLFYMICLSVILSLLSASVFFLQLQKAVLSEAAVIIIESVDARFEPFPEATTFFELTEGEAVVIVSQKQDWVKIKRLDQKQGWIKAEGLELL